MTVVNIHLTRQLYSIIPASQNCGRTTCPHVPLATYCLHCFIVEPKYEVFPQNQNSFSMFFPLKGVGLILWHWAIKKKEKKKEKLVQRCVEASGWIH